MVMVISLLRPKLGILWGEEEPINGVARIYLFLEFSLGFPNDYFYSGHNFSLRRAGSKL